MPRSFWLCLLLLGLLAAPAFAGVVAPLPEDNSAVGSGPDAKFSPPATNKGANSPLAAYTTLLKEMEQQTKFSAQLNDWRTRRLDWLEKLNDAGDVPGHAAQLAAYEASLLDHALIATWPSRRAAWRQELTAAATLSRLAALTDELANNLQPAAMDGSWRARRELWRDSMHELMEPGDADDNGLAPAADAGSAAPAPPDLSARPGNRPLNSLLIELEAATRRAALTKHWRDRRAAWLAAVHALDTVGLRAPLQQLGEAYLAPYFAGDWRPQDSRWSARVRAAGDLSALAELLLELENNIEWTATDTSWPDRSQDWRRRVAAAGAAPAMVPPGVAPDAEREDARAAYEFAAALRELEKNTAYSAQDENWRAARSDWLSRVKAATTAAALRAPLQEFARSLLPAQLLAPWPERSNAWQSEAGRATSCAELAGLLLEFENQLRVTATKDAWRAARSAWRDRLTALCDTVPAATTSAAATTPPAGTGNLAALAGQCAALMAELENRLPYSSQLDIWRNNRPAWTATNRSVRTVADAGRQLLALEGAMRASAMRPEWSGRQAAWRSAISAAATLPAIIQLLREFEQSIAPAAFDRSWPAQRAEWLARLDELAAGRSVNLPPATT